MADPSKSRGSNFTGAELTQLCASWMHVSQDPIVGSGQKQGAFWDRTLKHYNDNKPKDRENRNVRSLETKWSEVKRDVARFSGCYSDVVDARHSGDNEEDTIRKAKELYALKDPKSKEFQYIDQWDILKNCSRWAMSVDDMKQKAAQKQGRKQKGKSRFTTNKENEAPNANIVIDDEDLPGGDDGRRQSLPGSNEVDRESLHFSEQRPIGNKVAKKLKMDENSTRVMAHAQRDMVDISTKRLKLAESQDRKSLLTLRVADVDEECREYFLKCRAKELRIAMLKLEREEEEEERALRRRAVRTPLPQTPPNVVNTGPSNVTDDVAYTGQSNVTEDRSQPTQSNLNLNRPLPTVASEWEDDELWMRSE